MSETGSVKFKCEQVAAEMAPFDGFVELNGIRSKLRKLGLLGVDPSGIGFGNVSVRDGETNRFYITGAATGGISELTPADCARVLTYDFKRNWLRWEGSAIASSESLTHAAVYESDAEAGAVIHCHGLNLWTRLLDQAPTTSKAIEYGTPAMAYEVQRLFRDTDVQSRKIFVMAGHEGGVVAFGRNLEEAFAVLTRSDGVME